MAGKIKAGIAAATAAVMCLATVSASAAGWGVGGYDTSNGHSDTYSSKDSFYGGGDVDGLTCALYAPYGSTGISTYLDMSGISTNVRTTQTYDEYGNYSYVGDNAYMYLSMNWGGYGGDYGLVKAGDGDWSIMTSDVVPYRTTNGVPEWCAYNRSNVITYDSNYIDLTSYNGAFSAKLRNAENMNNIELSLVIQLNYENGQYKPVDNLIFRIKYAGKYIFSESIYYGGISSAVKYNINSIKFGRIASMTHSPSYAHNKSNYVDLISKGAYFKGIKFKGTYYYYTAGYAPIGAANATVWMYPNAASNNEDIAEEGIVTTDETQYGDPIVEMTEVKEADGTYTDYISFENYDDGPHWNNTNTDTNWFWQ